MKNKDRFDLTGIDFYEEDDSIFIYRIGRQLDVIAVVTRYFDEPAFRAFLRWLETDSRD